MPAGRKHPGIPRITCVDLFCGAGGLSYGLRKVGIRIAAGVDLDPACRFPYETNTGGRFVEADLARLDPTVVQECYSVGSVSLLAGCAPCQPFSTYTQAGKRAGDRRWALLSSFGVVVEKVMPALVTMENVPGLERTAIFATFLRRLERLSYHISWGVLDCADYGVPQYRRRLVLLASRLGAIELPPSRKRRPATVRDAIGHLPAVRAGEVCPSDALHAAARLSELNMLRVRHSRPGGTWRDWPRSLVSACHKSNAGSKYPSVYGRMEWDRPAGTITTLCNGFGNGRFGHPEQDRAITLREAALLQSFPRNYRFAPPSAVVRAKTMGRLIGNAVPPNLAAAIGRTLSAHVAYYYASRDKTRRFRSRLHRPIF